MVCHLQEDICWGEWAPIALVQIYLRLNLSEIERSCISINGFIYVSLFLIHKLFFSWREVKNAGERIIFFRISNWIFGV